MQRREREAILYYDDAMIQRLAVSVIKLHDVKVRYIKVWVIVSIKLYAMLVLIDPWRLYPVTDLLSHDKASATPCPMCFSATLSIRSAFALDRILP